MIFNVIKFVGREKGGCLIPLNDVNDRIHSMLGISMTLVERIGKRNVRKTGQRRCDDSSYSRPLRNIRTRSSWKRTHCDPSPILLTENQNENIR